MAKRTKIATTETPPDFPVVDTPQNRINIRKALAGLYLLQGRGSMKRCLIDAGYSRSTARLVTQAGLSAESCLKETAKLEASANPAKLLETARRRAAACIEAIDPKTAPLRDVVRMLDTTEKYYGGYAIAAGNQAFSTVERLAAIGALFAIAQARGLPVPAPTIPYLDAETSDSTRASTAALVGRVATRDNSVQPDNLDVPVSTDGTTT